MKKIYFLIFLLSSFGVSFFLIREIKREIQPEYIFQTGGNFQFNYRDFSLNNFVLDFKTKRYVSRMTNEELAGVVLMPALEKHTNIFDFAKLFKKYHLGGYMVLSRELQTSEKNSINEYSNSDLPLLFAVDAESSLLKYRLPGLAFEYETSDLNTDKKIKSEVARISDYLKQKSVNINFAPVYDVGINKAIIGKRAFSSDNKITTERAQLFADSSYDKDIFPTAKHFPGHGNVIGDTHKKLQTISGELKELGNFKHAIDNNIPIIMVGHLAVENNKRWNTNKKPATISKNIMTNLLRDELNFKGLIITDAMNMGALNDFRHREIQSLKAGADIILIILGKFPEALPR